VIVYKNIKITDRDWELLKFLGEYRLITIAEVGKLFGTEKYHQDRVTVLKKAGLVCRNKNSIYLSRAGRELLKQRGIPCYYVSEPKVMVSRYSRIANFVLDIAGSDWKFTPSWRYKEDIRANRSARLYGVIENGSKTYAVYNIGKEPQKKSLYNLKRELEQLPAKYGITRAVIFAESDKAIEAYGEESLGLSEQLLLLYGDTNLALLRAAAKENLIKKAAQLLFEHGGPPEWKGADYTVDNDRQAVVLIFNDIEKIARLNEYAELLTYRRIRVQNNVVIVCLKDREEYYREKYPMFEVMAVEIEVLINKSRGDLL